jgi:hypothetical protein
MGRGGGEAQGVADPPPQKKPSKVCLPPQKRGFEPCRSGDEVDENSGDANRSADRFRFLRIGQDLGPILWNSLVHISFRK